MKQLLLPLLAVASASLAAPPAPAAPRERTTVEDAAAVVAELGELRERGIPPALLRDASAVVIAPDVLRGGLVVAVRHGHGVLLMRDKDGGWANPVFVTITGGSFGFQAGVQATDLFLVVRNRRSLDRVLRGGGKLTLGVDASAAAGPLGRQALAATDAQMRAEILSYSRNRGVFAGVAIDGDSLLIDREANERFYGKRGVTVADIVAGKITTPEPAAKLRERLTNWPAEAGPKLPARLGEPSAP